VGYALRYRSIENVPGSKIVAPFDDLIPTDLDQIHGLGISWLEPD
jgi:hypothetical protein